MAENTQIQWCHHTFNHIRGCTKISPGCANCYADQQSKRNPSTLGVWGPNGTRVVAAESYWKEPLKWDRKAKEAGFRRRVFCASLADVFENWQGPIINTAGQRVSHIEGACEIVTTMNDVRRRLFKLINETPNLDWLLLTKRPENILDTIRNCSGVPISEFERVFHNVWLGTSVEDQQRANERIPELLKVEARVRFLSVEPMLGPIDLSLWVPGSCEYCVDAESYGLKKTDCPYCHGSGRMLSYDSNACQTRGIDWVICGGESGGKARRFDIQWARSLRDQCREAGTAFFMKQMGSNPEDSDPVNDGAREYYPLQLVDKKGGSMDEWPEDLRIREFPKT